jgi:hypothetical protein
LKQSRSEPLAKNILKILTNCFAFAIALFAFVVIVAAMIETQDIPDDLQACQARIRAQAAANKELTSEIEKLRKLLSYFVNGHRSEKRIFPAPNQDLLPFENSKEFEAARAEAEAQAEAVIQKYTGERKNPPKKRRDESLPSHLRREERIIEADA